MKSVKDIILIWDKWNRDHIKKHKVTVAEVEQAFNNKVFIKRSYLDRVVIFGKTDNERFITVVLF